MIALLSFDLEEWFHGIPDFGPAEWSSMESTLEAEFDLAAEALARSGRSATFFVLDEVARAHPELVRRISGSGWEVASHGSGHAAVCAMSREEFRESLRRSVGTLEELSGAKVTGYRAPMWSIRPGCDWAVHVLLEEGIEYDSSLLISGRRDPRGPFMLGSGGAEILEVPPAPLRLGPFFYPLAGGFSWRLAPMLLYRPLMRRAASRGYVHAYIHPWEMSSRPRPLGSLTLEKRFFFSAGRGRRAASKFMWLLGEIPVSSIRASINAIRGSAEEVRELAEVSCHAVKRAGLLQRRPEGATP